ncbi:hypothetical protein F4775DRAFT_607072 [Biscogniauxia sp. FL1348]|nr:hypothetical protein F4775DRAFT_607072 [Biscogniauxia sp. FL1348]
MLPPALASTYQQYKRDTDSVAEWLASTAKSCGYLPDLPRASASAVKDQGRLKDKARAEAKKNRASSAMKPTDATNKYTIKLDEFVPLAEYISGKTTVSIPPSFGTTLDRVIAVRSTFKDKLEASGTSVDELLHAKHEHFVGILEKVREALKPRMKYPQAEKSTPDVVANMFAALKVYEPSDDFLNAPDIERPQKVKRDKATYEAEIPTGLADLMIALTMLINDLNMIRSRIEWIWSNYRDGFFDLIPAAVATNTAIDLARNLMEEVTPMFKEQGGIWFVLNKFYLIQAHMAGYSIDDLFTGEGTDNFNYDTYDIAKGTYILTCRVLEAFIKVIEPGTVPIHKEGSFGYYDPQSDRASKSGRQKFEEDRVLLMTFFTELMVVHRSVPDYPVEDEFLCGIKELDKTKQVPFYLVFAAQVFLDIHHTLRTHADRACETLMTHLDTFSHEIDEHFKFHKDLTSVNWPMENDNIMRRLQARIQHIKLDPVYQVRLMACLSQGMPPPPDMEPNRILKMSPLISGLMLYHFRAEMLDVGIVIADAWGSITYSLHLYNALKSERLLRESWPDMDIVQALLGDSKFFVGGRPTNIAGYFKKYSLQMGWGASAFVNDHRPTASIFSQSGPRAIEEVAPVFSMFRDRYVKGTGQVDWTPEQISKIIDLGLWEAEGSEEKGTLMLGQIVDPEKLKEKAKAKKSKKSNNSSLPPEQLIRALMLALQGESLESSVPYMAMHRECWELLRTVRKHCDPLLQQIFIPEYIEQEYQLSVVVGYVFMAAYENRDMRLMFHAADAVKDFVRRKGSTITTLMHDLGITIQHQYSGET